MTTLGAAPGDVLAVWTSSSLTSDLIRVGEALRGLPAVANHVAIITHQDQKGRWIGIQGRPGGVGYAHPDLGRERKCEPADWWNWSDEQLWTKPGA